MTGLWIFNVLLFLCSLFNIDFYQQLRKQGATCYAFMPGWGNESVDNPPPCPYLESEIVSR